MMNFIHFKITQKLTLLATLVIILTIMMISILVGSRIQKFGNDAMLSTAEGITHYYASAMKAEIEVPLDELRAIAPLFSTVALKVAMTRQGANLILKSYLEDRPDYQAIYLIFEPDTFDHQDAQFVNHPEGDSQGRFTPYWSRNSQGEIVLERLQKKHEAAYLTVKRTKVETILDPYVAMFQGQEKLVVSLLVPLLDKQGQFIAMVGMDIFPNQLGKILFKKGNETLEEFYLDIYSPQGILFASSNPQDVGKTVNDIYNHPELVENVLNQKEFSLIRFSQRFQKTVLSYGTPLSIGKTDRVWIVTATISNKELTEHLKDIFLFVILIGV